MGRPWAAPGQVVGLLGGSFDPPHAGHVHLTREALKRLRLDQVWWLVSPGNPIKRNPPAPLAERIVASKAIMRHPRVRVTDLEKGFGTRATADTLRELQKAYPLVRFVWLMGADNLAALHTWDRWPEIMARVPVAVLARPGQRMRALNSPAAKRYRREQVQAHDAEILGHLHPPAWLYLDMPMRHESSTALRNARRIAP